MSTLEGQVYASYGSARFGINGSVYGYESDGYRDNNRNEQQNNTLNLRWAVGDGALDLRFATDSQDLRLPGATLRAALDRARPVRDRPARRADAARLREPRRHARGASRSCSTSATPSSR